jgi:hypothetical protein
MLIVAFTVSAQTGPTAAPAPDKQEHSSASTQSGLPPAEQHLRVLSEKLDLTADQQAKLRPILQQMFDERQKVMQDDSLSTEARQQKESAALDKADKQARNFLNDDQKQKLDALERQPHQAHQ